MTICVFMATNGLFWVEKVFRKNNPKLGLPVYGKLEHAFHGDLAPGTIDHNENQDGEWIALDEARARVDDGVPMMVTFTLDEIHEAQKEIEGSSRKAG